MNNFVFYSPTEFVFGKDTEMQVGALAGKYGARKVMIVYGGGSVLRSGLLDRVKQSLQKAGIRYCEMGGVQPNPVDTKVYEGIEICRREQADLLLPVGGGSVIDTAKAIAAGVPYEGDFWDFFIGKAKVTEALKVAVVLTIPAAGSEGSGNSVITKVDTLQKLSLRVPELLRTVISRILFYAISFFNDSRQRTFTKTVANLHILRISKITFHDMHHHIGNAASRLKRRQCISQFRIHNGKDRAQQFRHTQA